MVNRESALSEAFISPVIVTWARERLNATNLRIAKSIHVTPARLRTWESGESRPTFRQAQMLAHALRIPFAFLYLKEPPVRQLPLPDRRVVALKHHPTPSVDLIDVANAVKRKQDWCRDYRLSQSADTLAFVGSQHQDDDPALVAESMRTTLSFPVDFYRASKSWSDHLARIVRAAESIGILVFRSGVVGNNTRRTLDVSEFRGLAISDPIAPAVFINARDAKSAQVFTIAHELAHIWIGESAATDASPEADAVETRSGIETFCNRVATEFLVPRKQFAIDWPRNKGVHEAVVLLAGQYRVSGLMILRRAFELRYIVAEAFYKQLQIEKRRKIERTEKSKGGNFDASFAARNGRPLIGRQTLYREAASILEIGTGTLARLVSEAALSRGA